MLLKNKAIRLRTVQLVGCLTIGLAATIESAAQEAQVPIYSAIYDAYYKGKRVGTSEFKVEQLEQQGHFRFTSNTRVKGLLRLISPNPAIELSTFELIDNRLRPLDFRFEDGSRKGEDNFSLDFDWTLNKAMIAGESGTMEVPLETGLLDRGSMQVAVMRDMARCVAPGPYSLLNDDGIETYYYEREGSESTETGLGLIEAKRFLQQRDGSSRSLVLWAAPELAYLPARMEQFRNGEAYTSFVLQSVTGIEKGADPCR